MQTLSISPRTSAAFWVSTSAMLMLLLANRFGTVAVAGYVGLWSLYVLAWPLSTEAVFRNLLPCAFPLFALLSTAWSNVPVQTARLATEWMLVVAISVIVAKLVPVHRLLASWALAIVPVVIVGSVLGGTQNDEYGATALTGLFTSKNNFALHVGEMLLVCLAVLVSRRQPLSLRLIAAVGCMAAPLLLLKAKSIGAMVVIFPAVMLFFSLTALRLLSPRLRLLAVAGSLACVLTITALTGPVIWASKGEFLTMVGKNEDLTGRGLLWMRAGILIAQRPTFGVGYSAFWVQGNPEAEALWQAEHVPSGSGFHFHNFYYETMVELGYTGLAVGVTMISLITVAVVAWGLRCPGPESAFFCAALLFFWMRSFVELDLLGGFGLHAMILPTAWAYANRSSQQLANG